MKLIVIIIIIGLFSVPAFADEVQDLKSKKNNISLTIIQYQAQGQLLAEQWQAAVETYVDKKREIQDVIDNLRKQLGKIDKQIKALETAPAKSEQGE